MFYEQTIKNIIRMLKPNGIFIFTCGGEGRPEHGTIRQGEFCAPLLQQISEEWANYYKNLTKNDIVKIDNFNDTFPDGFFLYNPYPEIPSDLYFFGVKGGFNDDVNRDKIFTNEMINSYKLSSLDEIANRHNTDKGSNLHDYCKKYEKYLKFDRTEPINIMEIGVLGGSSLKMWTDYYYNSNILGIDINPNSKEYEGKNIDIEIGSQNDINFLNRITNKYGKFDLIIDDGSHNSSDVITSFENLFYSLNSGGVYVVEDSCTSYWSNFGGGYLNPNSMVEYFKRLSDDISFRGLMNYNAPFIYARREDWCEQNIKNEQPDCRTDIESITFLNGIILIRKR
jgi:SAM-dependent methyltransferase